MKLVLRLVVCLLWLPAVSTVGRAQPVPTPGQTVLPPESAERLDALFLELADEAAAEPEALSRQITALWSQSGSDSVDFLLQRGREAMQAGDHDKAIEHLSALVEIEPGFAEGWNARATVYYMQDDYWASVADIQQVLALEPRHFGALAGLATMLERVGAEAAALAAHRAALAVNPHLEGARDAVERLAPKVDGRDI